MVTQNFYDYENELIQLFKGLSDFTINQHEIESAS